jgi:hypothetical protein
MAGVRWFVTLGVLSSVILVITWGCGLPPMTWIEQGRYVSKAEAALASVSSPSIPAGLHGDVFTYPDGWLVVLYGQSEWTGHNIWNYNLAKDAAGHEYLCRRHFCTGIRHRYDQRKQSDEFYLKTNPEATSVPNLPDPELDQFKALIEARTLADATGVLITLGFIRR